MAPLTTAATAAAVAVATLAVAVVSASQGRAPQLVPPCADGGTPQASGEVPHGTRRIAVDAATPSESRVEVVWAKLPWTSFDTQYTVCSHACAEPLVAAADEVPFQLRIAAGCDATVTLLVPAPEFSRTRAAARVADFAAGGGGERVVACSDGDDNDGDGRTDTADPGCASWLDDDEEAGELESPPGSNFAWTLGADSVGAFIASLSWRGKALIKDEGAATRFYPNTDAGQSTSDIQLYEPGMHPWQPNRWFNGTQQPFKSEQAKDTSVVIGSNDPSTGALSLITVSPSVNISHVYAFSGDGVDVTINVTNKLPQAAGVYFPVALGNLQLGTTSGCKCPLDFEVGATGNCSGTNPNACETGLWQLGTLRQGAIHRGQPFASDAWEPDATKLKGWREVAARGNSYGAGAGYSPCTGLGDTRTASIGLCIYSAAATPDSNLSSIEMFNVPAAPTRPLISPYIFAFVEPGASFNFTMSMRLAPPAPWSSVRPTLQRLLQPYADFFHKTYGPTHTYCPSGTMVYRFVNDPNKNHTYPPGTKLWDVLGADKALAEVPHVGSNIDVVWQGQIYSSLLTTDGKPFEFNPASNVLDPNVDAACDVSVWHNLTAAYKRAGVRLGWFARPCSDIATPDGKPAGIVCHGKTATVIKGDVVSNDLTNPESVGFQRYMARVATIVDDWGLDYMYWDSFFGCSCPGHIQFARAVMKRWPQLGVMGEGGNDVESLFIGQLPWWAMPQGTTWDPTFEPDNTVLGELLVPGQTAFSGPIGGDQVMNHSLATLGSSVSNSFISLDFGLSPYPGPNHDTECEVLPLSNKNWAARMKAHPPAGLACPATSWQPPVVNMSYLNCSKAGRDAALRSEQAQQQLDVSWDADGNMTLSFGAVHGVGLPLGPDQFQKRNTSWDASTRTYTTESEWGTWSVAYTVTQATDEVDYASLDMTLSYTMASGGTMSDTTFEVFAGPRGVNLPKSPPGKHQWDFWGDSDMLEALEPPVVVADFGTGAMVSVVNDGAPNASYVWFCETNCPPTGWHSRLRVAALKPGQSRTINFALRFGPGSNSTGSPDPYKMGADVYGAFAKANPYVLDWKQRGGVGMNFIAQQRFATPVDPSGYGFADDPPFDVTTPAGQAQFKRDMMAFANQTVSVVQGMDPHVAPQGVILWDLEGEGDPWATYVGTPKMLPTISPHFDAIADEYIGMLASTGLRIGLTLRGQQLVQDARWNSSCDPRKPPYRWVHVAQYNADNSTNVDAIIENLSDQVAYSLKRWNVTMFYVDSAVDKNAVYHPRVFQTLHARYPQVLFIPEESRFLTYSAAAPLCGRTPGAVAATWGTDAWCINLMQSCCKSVDPATVATYAGIVREGDALMFDSWWNNPTKNKVVEEAYAQAAERGG